MQVGGIVLENIKDLMLVLKVEYSTLFNTLEVKSWVEVVINGVAE